MVPVEYIDGTKPVIDAGMATLAAEVRDGHYVFDGASVTIECMLGALDAAANDAGTKIPIGQNHSDIWERLTWAVVSPRPAGAHRSYDLVAEPDLIATQ